MASIKDRPVGYLDELTRDYTADRRNAKTLAALWKVIAKWEPVAGDAFDVVSKMTKADYQDYCQGEAQERNQQYAGDEWAAKFGAILLPEMLLRIAIIAHQFHVPDGCAFIRAVEVGRFKKTGKHYVDVLKENGAQL